MSDKKVCYILVFFVLFCALFAGYHFRANLGSFFNDDSHENKNGTTAAPLNKNGSTTPPLEKTNGTTAAPLNKNGSTTVPLKTATSQAPVTNVQSLLAERPLKSVQHQPQSARLSMPVNPVRQPMDRPVRLLRKRF